MGLDIDRGALQWIFLGMLPLCRLAYSSSSLQQMQVYTIFFYSK